MAQSVKDLGVSYQLRIWDTAGQERSGEFGHKKQSNDPLVILGLMQVCHFEFAGC